MVPPTLWPQTQGSYQGTGDGPLAKGINVRGSNSLSYAFALRMCTWTCKCLHILHRATRSTHPCRRQSDHLGISYSFVMCDTRHAAARSCRANGPSDNTGLKGRLRAACSRSSCAVSPLEDSSWGGRFENTVAVVPCQGLSVTIAVGRSVRCKTQQTNERSRRQLTGSGTMVSQLARTGTGGSRMVRAASGPRGQTCLCAEE